MHQYLLFTGLILGQLLALSSTAQTIKTAKDSAIFIECAKLPKATGEYNLGYTMSSFDLNVLMPETKKEEKPLNELLIELEKNPQNIATSLQVLSKYKGLKDQTNYETYLRYTYKQATNTYQLFPDSFELVEYLMQISNEGQNKTAALSVLEDYVEKHPKDVRGLTFLALDIAFTGELERAKQLTQQAYELEPNNHRTYFAAAICELANILHQLESILTQREIDKKALNRVAPDPAFFRTGILNGNPVIAQMGLDISNLFAIFYRTISISLDKNIGKEIINISPTVTDEKMLKAIEKRAKKQLGSNIVNLEYAHKTLCLVEIFRGHREKAAKYWTNSSVFLQNNSNIPRLISLLHLFQLEFDQAIDYTQKVLDIAPNYNDQYVLGRLYSYQGSWEKAYDAFEVARIYYPSDQMAVCAKVSTRINQRQFKDGFSLLEGYSNEIRDNINLHHINYFTALATLAEGDKNDAFKRLKAIHAKSEYKTDADKLLAYFFKSTE